MVAMRTDRIVFQNHWLEKFKYNVVNETLLEDGTKILINKLINKLIDT